MSADTTDATMSPKGRTRGGATLRADAKREPEREIGREPVRAGQTVVLGRDGQPLSRKRRGHTDQYHIDAREIPAGWTYEWKANSVINAPNTGHMVAMHENGWTPVPADRHPGRFMPPGYTGPITRNEMILMERPNELTWEALEETRMKTLNQTRAQHESMGLATPAGFSRNTPGARAATYVRTSMESVGEAPRPSHQLAIDE